MPRLRDTTTGSIVNVDDDLAERLGSAYEPVGDEEPRRATRRKASDDE